MGVHTRADAEVAATARKQYGLITARQAGEIGLGKEHIHYRVKQGRWERVAPSVYRIAGCPETWHQRLLAATMVHDGVASHRSALRLHGILGYRTDVVEVSSRPRGNIRIPNVTAHETVCFSPVDHTMVDGIPVTTVERTLIDAGAVHSPRFVEDALDECIRRNLTSADAVARRVQATAGQGRNGIGVMRAILDTRHALQNTTESVLESRFLRALRDHGVALPVTQHVIRLGHHVVARVDFAYPERRVAIEVDGLRYHASRAALEADATRQNEISAAGFRVFRFSKGDLAEPSRIAMRIARILEDHPVAA